MMSSDNARAGSLPVAQLFAVVVEGGAKSSYVLQFSAPHQEEAGIAAPAKLVLGDDQVLDLGVIVAPSPATWRTMRTLTLVENVPVGENGIEAALVWGPWTFVATVIDGEAVTVADRPTVALLHAAPHAGAPLNWQVELQVDGVPTGHSIYIDAGAGNQRIWTPSGPANGDDLGYRVEWRFGYSKPGPYLIVVDLIDGNGFWVDQVAEQAIEVTVPEQAGPTTEVAKSQDDRPALPTTEPLELAANAVALPAWEPYRYVRPLWAWARTYTQAGGSVVARSLALGTYLAVRQEVMAGGQLWYQTGAYDWIPASSVAQMAISQLRGVQLRDSGPGPDPDPDPDPDPNPLPKGTVTANVLNVRSGPGVSNPVVDQLRFNTQVTIYEQRTVAGAIWYRIGVGRWVHGGWIRLLNPLPEEPQPARRGVVTADVLNVRAKPGVSRDNPPVDRLLRGAQVVIYEETRVVQVVWYRIGIDRWVHGGWIQLVNPTDDALQAWCDPPLSEVAATVTDLLPLGWVVTASLNVRAEPATTGAIVGTVVKYDRLSILETRLVSGQRWYRIGEKRWVYGANIRVARLRARPAVIRKGERWVGVNVREQTVVAYEGDQPVYAALAATGLPRTPTVQGIFRTWLRLVARKMSGGSAATGGYYNLEEVPWTLYFYSGYALHGAYWHDAFGNPRSHGCVNLSLYDSWWIFRWSEAGGKNSPAVYVYAE